MTEEFIGIDNLEKIDTRYGTIYKPKGEYEPIAQNATLSVKFSNDIFLMKSFLDQQKIEYKEEDLEDSPMGRGVRIKRKEVSE